MHCRPPERRLACAVVSLERWFLSGFLTVAIVMLLLSRLGTGEPAAPRGPLAVPASLQPELALEQADRVRRPASAAAPAPVVVPPPPALPEAPGIADLTSAVAVEKWLENHAGHMSGESRWSRNDPLVDEFARVPSPYWGVMLAKAAQFTGKARGITEQALIRSAKPEHRELVLQAFPQQLFLIAVITRHGWVADSAEVMRRMLADPQFTGGSYGRTYELVAALATLQDERDFHRFLVIMRDHRFGYWQARIARALAAIPAFDLTTAVQSSWRHHDVMAYQDRQDGFAVAAARVGFPDALAITVLHAAGGNGTRWSSGELQEEARALLKDHLGLYVDPDDPAPALRWWESAKEQVVWDAPGRRWSGPAPPVSTVTPEPPPVVPGADDF